MGSRFLCQVGLHYEVSKMNEWNIEFVRRMNAFIDEYPYATVEDLKEFWEKFKPQVIEAYNNSNKWEQFCAVIEMAVDDVA